MSSPQKLVTAREKLHDTTIPLPLRVTYYLRILCAEREVEGMSYVAVMKRLFAHNPEWLSTCKITPAGELKSNDSTIHQLLLSIEQVYQALTSADEFVLMAA